MKKLILTYICFSITTLVLAQVSKQEKQVLLDLYLATNGAGWNNSWNLDQDVETWRGVTVENNKVIAINLLFNNLHGSLPPSLGSLENLKSLELSFNPISGTLPEELGNLKNLEVLAINATAIDGNIPASLGNLSQLKKLHLSSNLLTGTVPKSLGNLDQLEVFNVFDNDLFGILPQRLVQNHRLKELIVAENNFTNPENFSLILLSNSGNNLELFNSPQIPSSHSALALERETND